jgi:hypothetical protein
MTDRDRLERLITALDASLPPLSGQSVGAGLAIGKSPASTAMSWRRTSPPALVRLEKRLGFAAVTQDGG